MTTSPHIVHLTSAHKRDDTRIFRKQCRSLAKAGYQVTLIVADGKGDGKMDGISIRDVGKSSSRLQRMMNTTQRMNKAARELDAAIYHFHDPELLPTGLKLKKYGRTVIFDAHEDVAKQIMAKNYIPRYARSTTSKIYGAYEAHASRRLDAVICATPSIAKSFDAHGCDATVVTNYPIIGELVIPDRHAAKKTNTICYIGGLSDVRGIREIVLAAALTSAKTKLKAGGSFATSSFEREIMALRKEDTVDFLGWLDREQVALLLNESIGGLVTLHATPNHVESLPIKMFEYMSAGLPVIASDFPLWREIIEGADCGICIDPSNVQAIADAIDELASNPARAREMGRNGQRAVQQKYNWDNEAKKLLALCERLVGAPSSQRNLREVG